jgi:aspartyl-tRNA(Asn)/glutamyl-tRNA(Gln) amidotransferase subunit C
MKLSHDEVRHIAELAKLALTDEETERFAVQLSAILDYAEVIKGLDTASIAPTAQVLPLCNVTRPDVVQPSLSPDEVLANAPQRQGGYFQVKPILDE